MLYAIRYENYLEDLDISDFKDEKEARRFMSNSLGASATVTVTLVAGPGGLTKMAPAMRRDIWNLICKEGEQTEFETVISAEHLFNRIEEWLNEES